MSSRSLKNRPSVKKKRVFPGILAALGILCAVIAAAVIGVYALVASWLTDLPDYSKADAYNTSLPSVIYASDGVTELARFHLEYREPVEAENISQYVFDATIATEDERYYEHSGVDLAAIARAVVNNLVGGNLEGASTIAQQFVRNTILSEEMTDISLKRKVREMYIALQLEKMYSKDQILVMYLNTINYGSGAYGIEAAAQRYYSKHAIDLTLSEAAMLVGIPQSPTFNNPIDYPENALARRNIVLDRMLSNNYITQDEHDAAIAEPIVLNVYEDPDDGIYAYPYFTSYVRECLYNDFNLSAEDILCGGLRVVTTLDTAMQDQAETACANKRAQLGGGLECAMAVVEPQTGYVKALVGGADYYANQVNIATGQGAGGRPCGSSFKLFTLVTAIEQGIDPQATSLDCSSPATIDGYRLTNYGNINYGTRSIARAFAVSSNTGFVRLVSAVTPRAVAETARRMGIDSPLRPDIAGAALTLGVENVTPLEMAEAFATVASGGVHREATPIMTITDPGGDVIADNTDVAARGEQVLTPQVANAAEKVMETVITTYEGTGTAALLASGQVAAGKTGTTDDYKDITFVGITPQLSVSIWCGDPQNVMSLPDGSSCAPVFSDFLNRALAGKPLKEFPMSKMGNPPYSPYSNQRYHIYGYAGNSYGGTTSNNSKNAANASAGSAGGAGGAGGAANSGGNETGGNAPPSDENAESGGEPSGGEGGAGGDSADSGDNQGSSDKGETP